MEDRRSVELECDRRRCAWRDFIDDVTEGCAGWWKTAGDARAGGEVDLTLTSGSMQAAAAADGAAAAEACGLVPDTLIKEMESVW